jgi:hypothetical protein
MEYLDYVKDYQLLKADSAAQNQVSNLDCKLFTINRSCEDVSIGTAQCAMRKQ